ncbi:nucleoside diphosphate kinase regulator [Marinomonas algarum]|uniref:Nucleoside diphosphate kinase regulator n=1 Tax=Marinomonas algarum TaxID=2883105 RepID=A0A9X1RVT1_9GAMM|nr:nucleoside diphosphate kinase regulator [Marinomonas algarum]MCB5162967.1 nucleoside diphosphate kinase regulator [Marinomonas algarum]
MNNNEEKMTTRPDITISSLDLKRLEDLIDSLPKTDIAGVSELEEELTRATIVAPKDVPDNIVTMNSTVKFIVEATGKEFELTLVYPKDMDSNGKTISILAPVGSALLGLSIGDEIEWPKPGGGNLKIKIIQVTFQPERAGEYQL